MMNMINDLWHPISDATYNRCRRQADARDRQKRGYKTANYMNKDSNFLGLLGEALIGYMMNTKPDGALRAEGDGGFDFPNLDVKGCAILRDPHLKLLAKDLDPEKPKDFALVVIDLERRRARLAGFATYDMMSKAPFKDYGYGPRRHLPEHELIKPATFAQSLACTP